MKSLHKNALSFFFSATLIFGTWRPVDAQKNSEIPELLQEFFVSETVFAQEKNEIQITVRPAYWKNKEELEILHFPVLLEFGFADRFQVELTLPYQILYLKSEQPVYGKGNVEAGFLYNILKDNKPFALSVGIEVELPTAKKQKKTENEDEAGIAWEPTLIIARQFGNMQVHANLAAEITNSESEFSYNLATAIPFGKWLATVEINGEFKDEKAVYLTPGLIWKGIDDFEFGLGFSKGSNEWGVLLMATYEFSLGRK